LARAGNRNVLSDVIVSAQLAEAALSAAETNVRVNLGLIRDEAFRAAAERRLQATLSSACGLRRETEELVAGRG
jgi:formiminotetrahydrofolate cyclodeaminase